MAYACVKPAGSFVVGDVVSDVVYALLAGALQHAFAYIGEVAGVDSTGGSGAPSGSNTSTGTPSGSSASGATSTATPGGKGLTFSQPTAALEWILPHNFGCRPSVTICDSTDSLVLADVAYPDLNNAVVVFSAPVAGTGYVT